MLTSYWHIRQTIYLSLCITIAWNNIFLRANLFLHFSINVHTDKQAVDEQAKTSAVNVINSSSVSVRNHHLI